MQSPLKGADIQHIRTALSYLPPGPWEWVQGALYSPGQIRQLIAEADHRSGARVEIECASDAIKLFLANAPHITALLLEDVERLRSRFLDLAARAENGLSAWDMQAFVADSLGLKMKELRHELTRKEEIPA